MNSSKELLISLLVLILFFVVLFLFLFGWDWIACTNLGNKTDYTTQYVFPDDCYIQYNNIWYPQETLFQVLGQDFQYNLDLNMER